ncbi:hypothetical protein JTE90_016404 [Oedothorax gibbosus]|uniref:Secreted protein n=1 Tax=Oedothorax gibbosus TaxID=931172 RepID=A0AAV6TE77_9ARAC|nr:hypothetical protein JTE90_016404 [Oedothorax gibbosus]
MEPFSRFSLKVLILEILLTTTKYSATVAAQRAPPRHLQRTSTATSLPTHVHGVNPTRGKLMPRSGPVIWPKRWSCSSIFSGLSAFPPPPRRG